MPNTPVLPDIRRVDRNKIDEYLLHPINGRGKASFFQAYGFALERWQELRDALLEHASAGQVAEVGRGCCLALRQPLHRSWRPAHTRWA